MIQYQILQNNTKRIIWQIVRRIANEILGVNGLMVFVAQLALLYLAQKKKGE